MASRFAIVRFDGGGPGHDVVDSYRVNGAAVRITGDGRYLVSEP